MVHFKSKGGLWLRQMHTMLADRLDAVAELVDLKRRVFFSAGRSDHMFAHHLLQSEYLSQVYMLALQRQWQGENYQYTGEAQDIFRTGQNILLQLDESRNPLGIVSSRVPRANSPSPP